MYVEFTRPYTVPLPAKCLSIKIRAGPATGAVKAFSFCSLIIITRVRLF